MGEAYLDIASSPVEIEVEIFDLPKFSELVCHVLFGSLFVNISYQNNPTFHSYGKVAARLVHRTLT